MDISTVVAVMMQIMSVSGRGREVRISTSENNHVLECVQGQVKELAMTIIVVNVIIATTFIMAASITV